MGNKRDVYKRQVQNPPIRAGKSVIYAMFAEGARRLEPSGELWLVIRKQQGAESAVRYLKTLFGRVEAVSKKGGFWVLRCTCLLYTSTGLCVPIPLRRFGFWKRFPRQGRMAA